MSNTLLTLVAVLALCLSACGNNTINSGDNVGEKTNLISGKVSNYPGSSTDLAVTVIDYDEMLRQEIEVATGTLKADGTLTIELPENPAITYELPKGGCTYQTFGEGRFLVARYFKIKGSIDSLAEADKRTLEPSNSLYPYAELQRVYASQATAFIGECGDSSNKQAIDLQLKKGWNFVKTEYFSAQQSSQSVIDSSDDFVWTYQYGP